MPLYDDLVRRALEARRQAVELIRESQQFERLSQTLRDAHTRRVALVRCAWCDRLKLGEEWLHLEAIGRGQQRIAAALREQASHGICPDCFADTMRNAQEQRRKSGLRELGALVLRLEQEPPSPHRESALQLLRETLLRVSTDQ